MNFLYDRAGTDLCPSELYERFKKEGGGCGCGCGGGGGGGGGGGNKEKLSHQDSNLKNEKGKKVGKSCHSHTHTTRDTHRNTFEYNHVFIPTIITSLCKIDVTHLSVKFTHAHSITIASHRGPGYHTIT